MIVRILKHAGPVILIALLLFLLLVAVTRAQLATGGQYKLDKAVVAGGGREKQGAPTDENGTTGQAVAGLRSQGGQYVIFSGFWTPDQLAPTAAAASISGRVTVGGVQGIRNAALHLVAADGSVRKVLTGPFGYYSFTDVPVGETYTLTIRSKRFTFEQPTRVISLFEDIADVNFEGVANSPL
jgi:hypothetical protein